MVEKKVSFLRLCSRSLKGYVVYSLRQLFVGWCRKLANSGGRYDCGCGGTKILF